MIDKKYIAKYFNQKFSYLDEKIVSNIVDIVLKYDNDNPIEKIDFMLEHDFYRTVTINKNINPYNYYFVKNYTKLIDDKDYLRSDIIKELEQKMDLNYFTSNLKNSNLEIIQLDDNNVCKTYLILDYFVCDKKLAPLKTKELGDDDNILF